MAFDWNVYWIFLPSLKAKCIVFLCLALSIYPVYSVEYRTVPPRIDSLDDSYCADATLVIGVSTVGINANSRKTSRETWASDSEQRKYNFRVLYFMHSDTNDDTVQKEIISYRDIVTLQNNEHIPTDMAILLWMAENCYRSKFFLTVFDDMYIYFPNFLDAIKHYDKIYMRTKVDSSNSASAQYPNDGHVNLVSVEIAILIRKEIDNLKSEENPDAFFKRFERKNYLYGVFVTRTDEVDHSLCKCALLQSYTSYVHVYSMWLYNTCEFEKSQYPCFRYDPKYISHIISFLVCILLTCFILKLVTLKKRKTGISDKNVKNSSSSVLDDSLEDNKNVKNFSSSVLDDSHEDISSSNTEEYPDDIMTNDKKDNPL